MNLLVYVYDSFFTADQQAKYSQPNPLKTANKNAASKGDPPRVISFIFTR